MDDLVVCIIPARGGSKRIKNKNIKSFGGQPLIAWTIQAAQKSGLFKRIIVSTECEEIAQVASEYIDVPFLREDKYDDYSTVSDVAIHVVAQCKKYLNEEYKTVAILQPSSPFRTDDDIKNIYNYHIVNNLNSTISCFSPLFLSPWWLAELDEKKKPRKVFDGNMKRSQDYPELYCPSGAVVFTNTEHLLKTKNIHEGITYYPIEWKNAIDLDTIEEFEIAEKLF